MYTLDSRLLNLGDIRAIATAARVPSTVAITADSTPTCRDASSESIHFAELKKFSYQRSENPFGGNEKFLAPENDMGMTIMTGRISNAMTTTFQARSHTGTFFCRRGRIGTVFTEAFMQSLSS
ncbi:hypothetical protein Pure05_12270 [Paenarthrobacter ureafaciens]|nr:hypothetical protein Pure01_08230 [Paenarthrobacter ureafaciens]GLU62980.1 hypothetical protein Pure02_12300 [Paenarthrobacter ureafaciens]GLU67254.1 hypothetical protein Pure03_12300 [Paenarthrobacter ureafaciens]GLU71166.1 hypothetical protein Pure04_08810 [Paenarthrobacter ureafaciens]GLU75787.1 hypothetical protein Pure05_12270 [Paenarthrobacter ureafaciens]